MATELPSDPPAPAWRPSTVPSAPATPPGLRWRREGDTFFGSRRRRRKRILLGVLLLCFVSLTAWLVWAFLWWQPPPATSLVLVTAGYETNLAVPHNVYGREGVAALADLAANPPVGFRASAGLFKLRQEPVELDADRAWDAGLEGRARSVVVFLALHGASDSEGPYLLRNDADGRADESKRLRLSAVLKRLGQLPADMNKVLILDATQVQSSWGLGFLHNDFARALARLEPDILAVPNLVVLSSSAEDQLSWSSEILRRTAFTHFLVEGLKGAADDNGDGRITAWELHRFVARSVEQWVRGNRHALQTPVLLPRGEDGERRARATHITLVTQSQPREPSNPPTWSPPVELSQAWERAQKLAKQAPPPAAYSPELWRRYLATLLRHEQLLRAGDTENAAVLFGNLSRLESAIRNATHIDLTSAENTLALPNLTGATVPDPRAASFDELWSTPPEERREKWAARLQAPAEQRPLFRTAIAKGAIVRAAQSPTENLAPAAALLNEMYRETRPSERPRPAEANFLAMLADRTPRRTLDPKHIELLASALRLRFEAEQAALAIPEKGHAYSEQVWPWIRTVIAEADRLRQLGQDLLFTGDESRFAAAQDYLRQAATRYTEAEAGASSVRSAIVARDQAFAELPGYCRWLAARVQGDGKQSAEVETLWRHTFALADLVGTDGATKPDFRDLDARAAAVRNGLAELKRKFTAQTLDLIDRGTIAEWNEAEAALQVPFLEKELDADKRLRLIATCRAVERRQLVAGSKESIAAEIVDAETNRTRARERAQRQGRMALAVLGRDRFDAVQNAATEDFDHVSNRLKLFSGEENWWQSLGRAGTEIGVRFRQLGAAADRLADEAERTDLPNARRLLRDADRIAQQLDGTDHAVRNTNHADGYRRLLTHDLLLGQARRTLSDHWVGSNDVLGPLAYYQAAGRLYVDDAARQVTPAQANLEARVVEQELLKPGRLSLSPAPQLVLTTERESGVAYQLQGVEAAGIRDGFIAFQLNAGPKLSGTFADSSKLWVSEIRAENPAPVIRGRLSRSDAAGENAQSAVTLSGYFRGQIVEGKTTVALRPVAEQTYVEYPSTSLRALAVRAPKELQDRFGEGTGSLVLILDCSGSMATPNATGTGTRFTEVLSAVRQLLHAVPAGTKVSLWAFGQAIPPDKTVAAAEETIKPIVGPTVWDPANEELAAGVMAKLEVLEPWNESPIVRAIVRAKADLAQVPGPKTILVLTDGVDNRFAKDSKLNSRGKDVPTFLADEFKNSGIVLSIVGFQLRGEEAAASEQFKVVERMQPPGRFRTTNDVTALADELRRATGQRLRYWVDREDNELLTEVPPHGLDVSLDRATDQWFVFPDNLPPGGYKVRVDTERRLAQNVAVNRGDLLLLNLVPGRQRNEWRRVFVTRDDYPGSQVGDRNGRNGWFPALLQNEQVGADRLQMLLMLEKAPEREEGTLRQLRPHETWIEVQPGPGGAQAGVRWGPVGGYAAPAWGVDAKNWPARTGTPDLVRPVVRMWWNPNEDPQAAATVERNDKLKSLLDVSEETRTVDADAVVIESVRLENQEVQTGRDTFEKRPCLVVRLRYPPNQPIKVRADGLQTEGQEHRYYPEVGKYTALLWPATEEQVRALNRLSLLSLKRFKREAERDGYFLTFETPGDPQPNRPRPEPPLLKGKNP